MDDACPRGGTGSPPAPPPPRCSLPVDHRTAGPFARALALWSRSLRLSRADLDLGTGRRPDSAGVWRLLSSCSCRPHAQRVALEPASACAAGAAARRRGDCPLAQGDLASHQKGAQAQQHTIFFSDESGFYPLPSVVRTYAPVGHTPILREWWTRDHLSAIRAVSPEGQLYCSCQNCSLNSEDVVALLEHLRREVPGRMVIIGDGHPFIAAPWSRPCWRTAQRTGCTWSSPPPMLPNAMPVRGCGPTSQGRATPCVLRQSAPSTSRTPGCRQTRPPKTTPD
jgi:DDE superfamily endonuclease